MRDIGKNIKSARIQKQMTQEELADKINTTRQTVSNYENGKSKPDIDMLITIADVFEMDVTHLIYGKTDRNMFSKRLARILLSALAALLSISTFYIFNSLLLQNFQRGGGGRGAVLVYLLRFLFFILCGYCIGQVVLIFIAKYPVSVIRSKTFSYTVRLIPLICLLLYCVGIVFPALSPLYSLIIDRDFVLPILLLANGLLISLS